MILIIRTEKIGVLDAFGANEKNFKRSFWHIWRELIRKTANYLSYILISRSENWTSDEFPFALLQFLWNLNAGEKKKGQPM